MINATLNVRACGSHGRSDGITSPINRCAITQRRA